jgi:hypothetical protein
MASFLRSPMHRLPLRFPASSHPQGGASTNNLLSINYWKKQKMKNACPLSDAVGVQVNEAISSGECCPRIKPGST